jgi:hypothetical protein
VEEKMKAKVRKLEWNNNPDMDFNSLGPLCDPQHLTPRNRAWHRYILGMMIDGGRLDIAQRILAIHPYLQAEFGERMGRAVREEQTPRLDW